MVNQAPESLRSLQQVQILEFPGRPESSLEKKPVRQGRPKQNVGDNRYLTWMTRAEHEPYSPKEAVLTGSLPLGINSPARAAKAAAKDSSPVP